MIKIYSVPECPYCNELKELLTKESINFIDVNVLLEENKEEYEQIYNKTESDEVPIVKVGNQLLVPNISFKSISEAVELTKNFLG
jgi:glutaredoxin 3|tara:strand:+ start:6412 stop:6666 length:255 start_codon:yes stop_codon:yes gene_type:complete